MLRFILSRIVQGIVVVFAVIVITFLLLKLSPGGPFNKEREMQPHVREVFDISGFLAILNVEPTRSEALTRF